jgi:hypothetical protein
MNVSTYNDSDTDDSTGLVESSNPTIVDVPLSRTSSTLNPTSGNDNNQSALDEFTNNDTEHNDDSTENNNDTDDGSDIDPNEPIGEIDLEICGLLGNGRSCSVHSECGSHLRVGDLLRLKATMITLEDGRDERAVKLLKITSDSVEGCTVGFIPRMVLNTPTVQRNLNQFCVVKELYCNSASLFKRQKSNRYMGMAGVVLLNEIPQAE